MATYPSTLPQPTSNGYQVSPVDQTVRTDMEVGTPRQRRRTAARNDRVSLEWFLTDTEMAAFRAWFDGDAEGGAAWFNGLSIAMGDGGLESANDCRFVGPWRASFQAGQLWTVTATIEVR